MDRNLARGLVLAAIALAFGLGALRYPVGDFAHAGAGLFPLMVSGLLLVLAGFTILRARLVKPEPLQFQPRNIGLLLLALCGFSLVSHYVNMIAGIIFMVLVASLAGGAFSAPRALKVAAALVLVALGFQKLLGLNLPLY